MHTDERGTIKDLLVTDDYSITHITFNEGAVRGNHYHKETTQIDFVLKGSLEVAIDNFQGFISEGMTNKIMPNEKHAYKAGVNGAEIVSICIGKRRGEHYEEDTFRLPDAEKLL
jgi:quercetin dioxygenase-like cupin family protein